MPFTPATAQTSWESAAEAAGRLWDRVLAEVDGLDDAAWASSTPCPDWSVRDLVAHLAGIQTGFDGGPQPAPPPGWTPPAGATPIDAWTAAGVAARSDRSTRELLDELRAARDGHIARLHAADPDATANGPTGPTTERGLFVNRVWDVWLHLQDLRDALGREVEADDMSAEAGYAAEYALGLVPWLFVKRAGAGDGACLRVTVTAPLDHDGVLAVEAGRARWSSDADPGDDLVRAAPGALALLTVGRGTPQRWRDAGALEWSGQLGRDFVERARIF